jgi:hypothetical protein
MVRECVHIKPQGSDWANDWIDVNTWLIIEPGLGQIKIEVDMQPSECFYAFANAALYSSHKYLMGLI